MNIIFLVPTVLYSIVTPESLFKTMYFVPLHAIWHSAKSYLENTALLERNVFV